MDAAEGPDEPCLCTAAVCAGAALLWGGTLVRGAGGSPSGFSTFFATFFGGFGFGFGAVVKTTAGFGAGGKAGTAIVCCGSTTSSGSACFIAAPV